MDMKHNFNSDWTTEHEFATNISNCERCNTFYHDKTNNLTLLTRKTNLNRGHTFDLWMDGWIRDSNILLNYFYFQRINLFNDTVSYRLSRDSIVILFRGDAWQRAPI